MGTTVESEPAGDAPKQPDIAYTPDYEKYLARGTRRMATEHLPRTLPPGFPERVEAPLAWHGDDMADTSKWAYELSAAEISELERALQHFKGSTPSPRTAKR